MMTHTITTQHTGHIAIPARALRSGDVVDLFGATTATVDWVEDLDQDMVCVALTSNGQHNIAVTLPRDAECIATRSHECCVCSGTAEARVGVGVDDWTHSDVSDLEILYTSLSRREITRDEAFPPKRVTAEELAPAQPKPQPAAEPEPEQIDPNTGEINPEFDDEAWLAGAK